MLRGIVRPPFIVLSAVGMLIGLAAFAAAQTAGTTHIALFPYGDVAEGLSFGGGKICWEECAPWMPMATRYNVLWCVPSWVVPVAGAVPLVLSGCWALARRVRLRRRGR